MGKYAVLANNTIVDLLRERDGTKFVLIDQFRTESARTMDIHFRRCRIRVDALFSLIRLS